MTNTEAITKLTNIMHDDHYSWHSSVLTAFSMAVDALRGAEGDHISRAAAIDALKGLEFHKYMEFGEYIGEDTREVRLIRAEKAQDALQKLPSAQPEQWWIPCSERLPGKEKKTYWVCTDTEYQCECRWTNNRFGLGEGEWGWSIFDTPQYSKPIAWMPLPAPYQKEGEEE